MEEIDGVGPTNWCEILMAIGIVLLVCIFGWIDDALDARERAVIQAGKLRDGKYAIRALEDVEDKHDIDRLRNKIRK